MLIFQFLSTIIIIAYMFLIYTIVDVINIILHLPIIIALSKEEKKNWLKFHIQPIKYKTLFDNVSNLFNKPYNKTYY